MEQVIIKETYDFKIEEKKAYINEYMKEYRKKNKQQWNSEKIKCDLCGIEYTKSNKSHHYRSKRHELNELKQKIEAMKKFLN